MLQVTVKADQQQLVNEVGNVLGWSRQRLYLATRRAVHKTGRYVYTRVVRQISSGTGIQQKIVRSRFVRLTLPKEHFPVAKIKIMDKGMPLIGLHPKKSGTGMTFRSGSGQEFRQGAFKATVGGGHVGIFARTGRARLPIKEQYKSVVIEEMRKHIDAVQVDAGERLRMEIRRQIDVMVKQAARGGKMRAPGEVGLSRSN